jgi:hypothetical protein
MQFFLYSYEQLYDYDKSVSSDSRALEIYHDSGCQKRVTENRNPLTTPTMPSL